MSFNINKDKKECDHKDNNGTDDGPESLPPDFQFPSAVCYICNGYYGPVFEEPVCGTCHAFLFPVDMNVVPANQQTEKTDDEDSGNDEPTDLFYVDRRSSNQQQQQSPRCAQPVESNNPPETQSDCSSGQSSRPEAETSSTTNVAASTNPENNNASSSSSSRPSGQPAMGQANFANFWLEGLTGRGNNRRDPVDEDEADEEEDEDRGRGDIMVLPRCYNWQEIRINGADGGEPSGMQPGNLKNLSERIDMLSNPKHSEHMVNDDSVLVETLPPEVLLAVFSHLDDVSLWSVAKVCRRWFNLLSTHMTSQQWRQHVQLRWPLYRAIGDVSDWYNVYDSLASSVPCFTCLAQTTRRTVPMPMVENSWRRKRLQMELKLWKTDPPEGIEATPLDNMCYNWQATITGPVGSPYEGGLFYLHLHVPCSYPLSPPVVRFLTKILHPNISRHGNVGIDSIHHNWSLALTISKILISVQSLLTDPYCQVCMEPELGEMYLNDRERFEEVARSWTWRYAMHDILTPS